MPSACPPNEPSSTALPADLHWDRILFCAKEATYKAWFPLTHRWLGFEDAHITFTVDGSGAAGAFSSRDPDRSRRRVRAAADLDGRPLVGARRSDADGDRDVSGSADPGIVVVDKPAGMTSHDVVGRCRRLFGTRKVGHAGTLDPMATGVLVVGIERATKILGLLTATDKSYAATIRLGQSTSTEDAEGELLQTVPADHVTDAADRRGRGAVARRHRAGAVVGECHQGRRSARLQAGPRGQDRRTGRAPGADRPVRGARDPAPRLGRRRRRRGRLLVGHLHPGAGPRRRRDAGRRRTPHRVAAHQGWPVRAGGGAHPGRTSRTDRG